MTLSDEVVGRPCEESNTSDEEGPPLLLEGGGVKNRSLPKSTGGADNGRVLAESSLEGIGIGSTRVAFGLMAASSGVHKASLLNAVADGFPGELC